MRCSPSRNTRYRRPSLSALLGISQAKRRIKKATGIARVERVINTPTNLKRRALRRVGYYSGAFVSGWPHRKDTWSHAQ